MKSRHPVLWLIVAAVFVWSYVQCHDRLTWFLEVIPVIIGAAILLTVHARWQFTNLVCYLLALHAIVLMVGGHYTYALVPVGCWVRDAFHLSRNPYDRLGHFLQGFVPAMIAREILLRRQVVRRSAWLPFIIVCICLAISATYELFEWATALAAGANSQDFLGTQGDPWDTQWDMFMALIGACAALLTLSKPHDRQLRNYVRA